VARLLHGLESSRGFRAFLGSFCRLLPIGDR
jgi:hypothetical protein